MKRARHSAPLAARSSPATPVKAPFNYELRAKSKNAGKYDITVCFSIPAEADECPLTLDLISESKLSFLPDTPFLLDRPDHKKLTLPCGHSFSALTLIYNFCKNSMACPCCRAGSDLQADIDCLPKHLRADFKAHLQQVLRQERVEDDDEAFYDIINNPGYVSIMSYSALSATSSLSLNMEFYNTASTLPMSTASQPVFLLNTILRTSESGLPFLEPVSDLRAIAHIAHLGVNAIRLTVFLSMYGVTSVPVDTTALTPLPRMSDEEPPRCLTIPGITSTATTRQNGQQVMVQLRANDGSGGGPATRFSVFFAVSGAFPHLVIRNIVWHPGTDTLVLAVIPARSE
jgi:hypothetical protein